LDQGSIDDITEYINDPDRFQILDPNSSMPDEEKEQREGSPIRTLSIDEFNEKYITDISSTSIDIQRSKI
jgi:hypothetical protein